MEKKPEDKSMESAVLIDILEKLDRLDRMSRLRFWVELVVCGVVVAVFWSFLWRVV